MVDEKLLKQIGQNIRKYRKLKKYSQEKLAEIVDVCYTTIGRIETGKLNTSITMIGKIAKGLEVHPKVFFDFAE